MKIVNEEYLIKDAEVALGIDLTSLLNNRRWEDKSLFGSFDAVTELRLQRPLDKLLVLLNGMIVPQKNYTEEQRYAEDLLQEKRRLNFLKEFPKNSIGAEVGVAEGNHSLQILDVVNPKCMYLIDYWNTDVRDPYTDQETLDILYGMAVDRFSNLDNVHMFKGPSVESCRNISDDTLDWVYIDASHDYESVLEDLYNWAPKVKKGGIITGHDYIFPIGGWPGVKPALDEYFEDDVGIELFPCLYQKDDKHQKFIMYEYLIRKS